MSYPSVGLNANEIAERYAQREAAAAKHQEDTPSQIKTGSYWYWQDVTTVTTENPDLEGVRSKVQVVDGLILVTDDAGDLSIICPAPGSVFSFERDAGE